MLWDLQLKKSAIKSLRRVSTKTRERIRDGIYMLRQDPFGGDVKKLVDGKSYRLRVGSYRIFFTLDIDVRVITVEMVSRRTSTTYKKK